MAGFSAVAALEAVPLPEVPADGAEGEPCSRLGAAQEGASAQAPLVFDLGEDALDARAGHSDFTVAGMALGRQRMKSSNRCMTPANPKP